MNLPELKAYFETHALPAGPVQLDPCTRVVNVPLFVERHISILEYHPGNKLFISYYTRLLKFYTLCHE